MTILRLLPGCGLIALATGLASLRRLRWRPMPKPQARPFRL
jgi:hypothetical protein